jgi:hypothetical protein
MSRLSIIVVVVILVIVVALVGLGFTHTEVQPVKVEKAMLNGTAAQ